ncbi:MAG: zinc ABC transporter substrate-binding protein [Muribaculaceae bacterium]|nr:zinc ABC transporter substrate-binding protein [Muribaculaceae bacterium]
MMKFNRYVVRLMALLLPAIVLSACGEGRRVDSKPVVTVSLAPQKYFLDEIAGDRLDVKCLLESGGNPESYEPSVANMRDLEESILYFRAGNMAFEDRLLERIGEVNPSLKVVDTSAGIDLIEGAHVNGGMAHRHAAPAASDDVDPHTWSSVKNARVIARNMRDALVEADPAGAETYNANYQRFDARLDSMDRAIAERLKPVEGEYFLVWHPSLSYFARDYGLNQIAVGHSTKESSIPNLQSSIDAGRKHGAKVFFFQKEMDSRQAEAVNAQIGLRRVDINPLDADWEADINKIVDAIAGADQTPAKQ